jgi:hypothetical protein
MRGLAGATLASFAVAAAIYPDDHWDYSSELGKDHFEEFVKTNVDGGKTVFVRYIASEG